MIKNKSYSLEEYYVGTGYRLPSPLLKMRFTFPPSFYIFLPSSFLLSLSLSFFLCPSLSGIKLVEAPSIYSHCMRMCILHWGSHMGQIRLNRFVCKPNTSQFISGKSKGIKMAYDTQYILGNKFQNHLHFWKLFFWNRKTHLLK